MVMWMVQFPESKLGQYIETTGAFQKDVKLLMGHKTHKPLFLDKSWAGIHYILTGTEMGAGPVPLALTIYSGQVFDKEADKDMWPPSFLYPAQVKEIYEHLQDMDDTFLHSRYMPSEMASMGIYPGAWDTYPKEYYQYLSDHFFKVKEYYKEVSRKGHAIASLIG